MQSRLLRVLLIQLVFVYGFASIQARAQSPVHPAEPTGNLGDTSFLDAIGGPGVLLEEIADGAHSGHVMDGAGRATTGSTSSNSISENTHVAFLSHTRVFGAWFGVEFLQAFAHVNAGPGSKVTGLGDLTVSPLILQWDEKRIGPLRLVQRVVLDFDVPTGEYYQAAKLNLSNHAFDVQPYYALTLFPSKHLESSWRVHYLWNATNKQPAVTSGAQSTQAGQAIHFNATVGYRLPHGVWVGANGYYLDQITDPKVDGRSIGNSPERVGAIGPGALWDMGHWLLFANAYHEVGALNRPEGSKVVLRLQWVPSRKNRTNQ